MKNPESWREWIAKHRALHGRVLWWQPRYRRPADVPGALAMLSDWKTCLVGEQVRRGVLPAEWADIDRMYRCGHEARTLLRLGAIASVTAAHESFDALEALLNQVEDAALAVKRSEEAAPK